MKRFILLLLTVSFLLSSVSLAETIDFSAMSLEELLSMYQQIGTEISEKVGIAQTNRIGRGSYVVGKDIKPGYYDFVCFDTDYFDFGAPNNDIYIYTLIGDTAADTGERIYWEQRFAIGSHVTFNLEEGTLLRIHGCSGVITQINPDWLP